MIIGVSELQKKISIFKNLTEVVYIVDKKSKQILATVLPQKQLPKKNLTESLAGSLSMYKPDRSYQSTEEMIHDAYDAEMKAKYAL